MPKKRGILYIFDLRNTQAEYAQCLEFISILQRHSGQHMDSDRVERLRQLARMIHISGIRVPEYAKNYYEEPLKTDVTEIPPAVNTAKKIEAGSIKFSILDESPASMHFHIRIHMEKGDSQVAYLSQLHHLALLLQRLDHILGDSFNRQLSVFIVPRNATQYPFRDANGTLDLDTYQTASSYLRLLSKNYTGVIYGVVPRQEGIAVRALDFRRPARLVGYLPLIPLDENTYPKLFESTVSTLQIDTLFSLRKGGRFPGANSEDPKAALTAFVMETAYYQMKDTLSNSNDKAARAFQRLLQSELKAWSEKSPISPLSFAIFLFTFHIDDPTDKSTKEAVRRGLEFANELCTGLRQLAQNTLQHSASREGIFTFYLERDGDAESLWVALSDFNDQQTFVENFVSNIAQEADYTNNAARKQRYAELCQQKDSIALGYFFGEYGDNPAEAWANFRKMDTSAHIGLLLFALTMQRCHGSVWLINSKNYYAKPSDVFQHTYTERRERLPDGAFTLDTPVIPGTHLKLAIPVGTIEESRPVGLGQLSMARPIKETYDSFAAYLDYQPVRIEFSSERFNRIVQNERDLHKDLFSRAASADAETKYEMVYCWEQYWTGEDFLCNREDKDHIFYFNMADLPSETQDSADSIEIFLKGFFNAADMLCKDNAPLLFAFMNMSETSIQILRQITISLALKIFPSCFQLYAVTSNHTVSIHLLGDTFCQAVINAYTLSLEHGTQAYSSEEVERAQKLCFRAAGSISSQACDVSTPQAVCPFDAILSPSEETPLSLFDQHILLLADCPIDIPPAGYKLENIHMRLGSKVHIRAFYEMAFLFYRTSISNRIAFELLRDLNKHPHDSGSQFVNLLHDDLIFYGYASYSKALLTSILEILKAYRAGRLAQRIRMSTDDAEKAALEDEKRRIPEHLAYVSYQHNLQSDFQVEDTELYFNFYNDALGVPLEKNRVRFNRPVKIIQIVPISSTLTTFDKMDRRLQTAIQRETECGSVEMVTRYTVFWVTDNQARSESVPREETEARYWKQVIPERRQILLHSESNGENVSPITYFIRSPVMWEDPLQCALCYPDDIVGEVPLVETDQTSTVPSQQIRGRDTFVQRPAKDHRKNDERLIQLKSCVTYGHIRREKNHFQFYLETQSYFNKVSKDVKKWLEDLRREHLQLNTADFAVLNIIFSPEHSTNVGFAQYVNNYYFEGNAEIVCVNEEKEYRSNFKCEHMALSRTIEDLLKNTPTEKKCPVRFYFADDTIITGETFHKAVGFLHSLIPARYQQRFPTNLIDKCFLLMDRLSNESKLIYVRDVEHDFLSFLHLDLSNMRIQGDSCVGCKLEMNAKKLLRRSATRKIAKYWSDKARRNLVKGYSKYSTECSDIDRSKAFRKLALAHITQNVLFHDNEFFELGNIYDSSLTIIAKIMGEPSAPGVSFQFDVLMEELRGSGDSSLTLNLLTDFLKLISRPFFSFDFKVRLQALTLLLIFSEYLINKEHFTEQTLEQSEALRSSPYKSFLFENGRIATTFRLLRVIWSKCLNSMDAQITFFQDCLMDCLVELRSTYMMRKATMSKLLRFLVTNGSGNTLREHSRAPDFWTQYVAGIHQILDCNNDETRALWLEYLLLSGEEYKAFHANSSRTLPRSLFQALTDQFPIGRSSAFFHFCCELFLQNNRVLFDGIESQLSSQDPDRDNIGYWKQGRQLDRFLEDPDVDWPSEAEMNLFNALKEPIEGYKVTERYRSLLERIEAIAKEKYGFKKIDIALITCLEDERSGELSTPEIGRLDLVSCDLNSTMDLHFNKYKIKSKLVDALSQFSDLTSYGYQVFQEDGNNPPYFFIYFDSVENPIVPVYLYFSPSVPGNHGDFNLMLLLRDILSYRNRLLKILRNDFAGDIFPKYAHTSGEKNILAHEKATSHNTTGDDSVTLDIFTNPQTVGQYSVLDSSQMLKWLLLHNYTNAQIAKLFNRSYRNHGEDEGGGNFPSPPPLYLVDISRAEIRRRSLFERPLRTFSDLRLQEDGRIALLDTAISLNMDKIKNAKFLHNDRDEFYNVEYFKNILIDIIVTAMKYGTVSASYLERIDKYLDRAAKLRHEELLTAEQVFRFKKEQCEIQFFIDDGRERRGNEQFRYLVIRNSVNKNAHNLFDWESHNQSIRARLESPIDYADGHMSLLTISQYIERLWLDELHHKTDFRYVEDNKGQLWFETRLPVIRKE